MHSGFESARVFVNGRRVGWSISPETNPDRLRVYCSHEQNKVEFRTDKDTVVFMAVNRDTIRISVVLNDKDTARTEIIGIRDLPNRLGISEKVYALSRLWSETKYNFVNIDKLGFSLDSLYSAFIPKVLLTANDYEYYQLLKRFMASLHDGHTEVSDNGQFSQYKDYITAGLLDFRKKIFISDVRQIPGQDSSWVGAEVTGIEGVPTLVYLENNVFPYISASTERHKWMQAVYRMQSGFRGGSMHMTLKKRDGSSLDVNLPFNGEETRTDKDKYWGPVHKYSNKLASLKWLDHDIAFVDLEGFYPEKEAIAELDSVAAQLGKAKAVIIDLRRNGGGSTEVAWQLQKYLTKGKYFLNYGWQTRVNDGVKKANGNWIEEDKDYYLEKAMMFVKPDTIRVPDSIKRIGCPVVILIGRYTFSAAEDFLVNFYEVPGRPLMIGVESGGSTGSPLVVNGLPGDGYARICTRRICYPYSGKPFVNAGVKPDIEAESSIDDYLSGRDAILERAIAELEKSMK